jgi:LuxR family transcriptional regulator, maltose regulon positive regulatory protein
MIPAVEHADAGRDAGGMVPRPGLSGRLGEAARVTVITAPAGSGKTVLLRSWISQPGLSECAAWVPAGSRERDPQQFWLAVLSALRLTTPGAALVQALSAAPDLDGWGITERLLTDLAPLADRIWLVIDDVHELDREVLRQLELLVLRSPLELRFVLATRHDLRLGLHRLRLEGELAEIRAEDLRFTLADAGQLLAAAAVELPDAALAALHERTEGWAAGLRLAALALARHPDPVRFAAEFSGTERTVADYLLAEVLDRQPAEVRRLLLRTSVLERVNGELARLLTGDNGAERTLQDLEQAGAFVVPLDATRTWFRYHALFADLLRLELRRTAPGEVAGLHRAAAGWFAERQYRVEAIRHAQAAQEWSAAARLLVDHWPGLHLDGQRAAVHDLLAGFPAEAAAADAELAVIAAADELAHGSLEAAERYLDLARQHSGNVPETRRDLARLLLGVVSLLLAAQRGNLPAMAEHEQRLTALARNWAEPGLREDLCALALISLGSAGFWGVGEDSRLYLERGLMLARGIGRPYLEFTGLAYQAAAEVDESFKRSAESASVAVELGRRHGWTDEPAFGVACLVRGATLFWQGQLDEAETWVQHAERTLRAETHPAAGLSILGQRGVLELARGKHAEALAAFQAAERMAQRLVTPQHFVPATRALVVQALVRLGENGRAERALTGLSRDDREVPEIRIAAGTLWLAGGDPRAALTELAPVPGRPAPVYWQATAHALAAIAHDELGNRAAADDAIERALDIAEPDGVLTPFLLHPAPDLLHRHARQRTAHAALVADILSLIAGNRPAPAGVRPPAEPLSESELRVLRYLPTNLTAPEIAGEMYVSLNTVKTHLRSLYAKLGVHTRAAAVTAARDLGLLAPSARRPS